MTEVLVYRSDQHAHLTQSFADIHMACTEAEPVTVANFVLPFTPEKTARVKEYWEGRLAQAQPGGTDTILMAFTKLENSNEARLSGYVILHEPVTESGPHRGDVQKLFVSPDFRRQGIARKLMLKLDDLATEHGRWLLTLSTAAPSNARSMYPKLGYIEYGGIPNNLMDGKTGELIEEVFFYKDLRKA